MNIFERIQNHQDNHLPFVAYHKPDSEYIVVFLQDNPQVYSTPHLEEKGFVFTNFLNDQKIIFTESNSQIFKEKVVNSTVRSPQIDVKRNKNEERDFHMDLVRKGVAFIKENKAKKIVLSRREEVVIHPNEKINYFKKMIASYPNAFSYWFFHPKIGEWMGATPEQLFKKQGENIQAVALAGTQTDKGKPDVEWKEKEKEEQQIVTDFIVEALKPFVREMNVSLPYTQKTGSLLHIKTDIQAKINKESDFENIITALHPTPALCGFPKTAAQDFIIANEGYPREFYSGYLGELHCDFANDIQGNSDLFVNLRCMQIVKDKAYLYLGGGITKDSIPEDEYQETMNKSITIKQILEHT